MKLIGVVAAGATLLSLCGAIPSTSTYVLHEKRDHMMTPVHVKMAKRSKIANTMLPIRIGLTQRDLHLGYDHVMDVSHPASLNYGKHWTAEEVNKVFAPTAETVQTVRDWLISAGIILERISVSDNKGWLAFDASVEEAEQLFRTRYYKHEHRDPQKYTVGCDEYYLPEHVREHVDYVTPGTKHQIYKRKAAGKRLTKRASATNLIKAPPLPPTIGQVLAMSVPLNCSSYVIDADCIRGLYQLPDLNPTRAVSAENTFGIFESGESYSQADLNSFFSTFASYIPKGTRPLLSSVDGGEGPVAQNFSGGESMLDLTIAYSLIYPQDVNFFSVDDSYWSSDQYEYGFFDTLLDAIDGSFCTYSAFGQKGDNNTVDPIYPDPHEGGYKGPLECGLFSPPKVLSVSYSEGESYLPVNYIKRQCNEWMKLGLQGTTTVFSSGDYGVSTRPGTYNVSNGCLGPNADIFTPSTWNECPYVLSVGATTIQANTSGYSANPEEAAYEQFAGETYPFTSGSGFSNIFDRPTYQTEAVKDYFQAADPGYPYYSTSNGKDIGKNSGLYNRAGRAYPDISANGAWWNLYVGGEFGRYGGTSMSTPLVASIINLINDARLKAGKSTVGFVNPTFYAHPEAFHDITVGANQGCGKQFAFNTTAGWDPPTGLGTPNFDKLKTIFMSLP